MDKGASLRDRAADLRPQPALPSSPSSIPSAEVTIDSSVYRHTFWGILNAQGEFWTPIAFESKRVAEARLVRFVADNPGRFRDMLKTHRPVPVRVQLTARRDSDQSREAGETEGLDPKDASAGRDSGIAQDHFHDQ